MAVNKEKQISVTVVLDKQVYNELKTLANNDQRSLSKYIAILIQNHINSLK